MPITKFYFAGGKYLFCRLSGKKFADGWRDTCNRQTFHLPTANKKFAVGKCAAGHRQISWLINGKIKFCHRENSPPIIRKQKQPRTHTQNQNRSELQIQRRMCSVQSACRCPLAHGKGAAFPRVFYTV
ncbi:MAG TPA: hypothetical protein IAA30_03855 [Candidatus Treponema faecavium]|nr:hypothetical protein [Candidatus Treponema faecavium]